MSFVPFLFFIFFWGGKESGGTSQWKDCGTWPTPSSLFPDSVKIEVCLIGVVISRLILQPKLIQTSQSMSCMNIILLVVNHFSLPLN